MGIVHEADLRSHRYTDFLVNEILPSGQVVHLDNLKVPRGKQQEHHDLTPSLSAAPAERPPLPISVQPESLASSSAKERAPKPGDDGVSTQPTAVSTSDLPDPDTRPTKHSGLGTARQTEDDTTGRASEAQSKAGHDTDATVIDVSGVRVPAAEDTEPLDSKTRHDSPQATDNAADAVQGWRSYANEPSAFQVLFKQTQR